MLRELQGPQLELAQYMSQLSELAYSAAWIENLEHALWRAVVDGPFQFGRLALSPAHVATLERLAAAADSWVRFDAVREETAVNLAWWSAHGYNANLARGA